MRDTLIPAYNMVRLFEAVPEVAFFVKDSEGRYVHVNQTLIQRIGAKHQDDVVGRDPLTLFPEPFGERYCLQDRKVLTGDVLENKLEAHPRTNGTSGWCLTCKYPLLHNGTIRGVIGISRGLDRPEEHFLTYERLTHVVEYLEAHYSESVQVAELAQLVGVSVAQLERHFRRVFQLSPRQMLTKLRVDAAMRMLREPGSIATIAFACGYGDQSAFTRQFRTLTGLTPGQYRALCSTADAHHASMALSPAANTKSRL